jgi:hypothetical protein
MGPVEWAILSIFGAMLVKRLVEDAIRQNRKRLSEQRRKEERIKQGTGWNSERLALEVSSLRSEKHLNYDEALARLGSDVLPSVVASPEVRPKQAPVAQIGGGCAFCHQTPHRAGCPYVNLDPNASAYWQRGRMDGGKGLPIRHPNLLSYQIGYEIGEFYRRE